MKIIQILNFTRLQSLKCRWFSWFSYPTLLFLSLFITGACNRQPVSCLTVEPNVVQLGQKTSISDCSDFSFNNVLKTGEGAEFSNVTTKKWAYYSPGTYQISIKTFSKRGNKNDTKIQDIVVLPPDSNLVFGQWQLNFIELREQLFVDYNIDLFENILVKTDTLNETYTITSDSLFVKHNIDNFLLFLNAYKLDYNYKKATLNLNNRLFEIVVFNEKQMILKGSYFKGYSLLYLTKI